MGENYGGNSCLQVKALLEEGKDVRLGEWKAADIEILNSFQLLTAKPVVYLVTYFTFLSFNWEICLSLVCKSPYCLYVQVSNACWILCQIHCSLARGVKSMPTLFFSVMFFGSI